MRLAWIVKLVYFITSESFKPVHHSLWSLWISKCPKSYVWTLHVFPNLVTYTYGNLFSQSYVVHITSHHITPLVIYSLRGRHTHIHTNTHTNILLQFYFHKESIRHKIHKNFIPQKLPTIRYSCNKMYLTAMLFFEHIYVRTSSIFSTQCDYWQPCFHSTFKQRIAIHMYTHSWSPNKLQKPAK